MARRFEMRDAETGAVIGTIATVDDVQVGAFASTYLRIDRIRLELSPEPVAASPAAAPPVAPPAAPPKAIQPKKAKAR